MPWTSVCAMISLWKRHATCWTYKQENSPQDKWGNSSTLGTATLFWTQKHQQTGKSPEGRKEKDKRSSKHSEKRLEELHPSRNIPIYTKLLEAQSVYFWWPQCTWMARVPAFTQIVQQSCQAVWKRLQLSVSLCGNWEVNEAVRSNVCGSCHKLSKLLVISSGKRSAKLKKTVVIPWNYLTEWLSRIWKHF